MADDATPFATIFVVPLIKEFTATAAPALNVTEEPVFDTGETIASVLISALVDFNVQVEIPEASDEVQVL
jgi:hypothetical protein